MRFGAAVALSALLMAVAGALFAYRDGAGSTADVALASSAPVSQVDAPAMVMSAATPIGGDESAVFEGEPAPEATVAAAVVVAAVVRPPTPSVAPPPPAVEVVVPEPMVIASHASLYDAVAAAFPDQADRAYRIVVCESSGNARANTGNGYYGLWQFDLATWRSVGGAGLPSEASVGEQVARARSLYERRGWSPWECAS